MLQVVRKHILMTGQEQAAYEAIGITKSTYYTWKKTNPELAETVARAHEERRKFRQREFEIDSVMAYQSLQKLMEGYEYNEKNKVTRREKIVIEETGEELGTERITVTETESTKHVRPDIKAIEKFLGPQPVWYSMILQRMEDFAPRDQELYKYVFGKLALGNDNIQEFSGYLLLDTHLDLVKLRYVEGMIQSMRDQNAISVEHYMDWILKIRKEFGSIQDKIEQRAQKLLDGKSYQEIIYDIETLWQVLIVTVQEVLFEEKWKNGYNPNLVVKEIVDRVREKKEKHLFPLKSLPTP